MNQMLGYLPFWLTLPVLIILLLLFFNIPLGVFVMSFRF